VAGVGGALALASNSISAVAEETIVQRSTLTTCGAA
jgi:hypothetical protein